MAAQIDYHNQQRVAAAAVVFLLVAMAALLLHRHGGAELWSRPTIATVETGARA